MIGQTLGHYRIVDKIGEGGMGEVYRAHDEHLDRDVAIKVLTEGLLADDAARKRFRKEALAIARLSHPNIGAVYDFDIQDDVDFLVLEYLPGQSLAERLRRGPLPERDVVELGQQVASALEEAHERGIIHRDLKPGNIVLTPRGQAKVLDFGLAKELRPAGEPPTASLTESLALVGTLPYMAPEQLRGEPADERADLWALGCVLYEMAAGQRPFRATVPAQLIDAIMNRAAPAPRELNPEIAPALERIILRCLAKNPSQRYSSARDLLADLAKLTPLHAAAQRDAPRKKALAVLPLENLMREPEQDYFVDGMTEALITELSRLKALKVISRTSVMVYKGVRKPLPEIGRELGVDTVVEGSVLRAGDQVRITAQLIDVATDEHLWADSYQRELRDILSLQSEVARVISEEIKVQVTPQERAHFERARQVDPKAYELLLQGRHFFQTFTDEGARKAIDLANRAIEQDPGFAEAYASLAIFYGTIGLPGSVPAQVIHHQALSAARKALELDDTLAEGHAGLGHLHNVLDWNWAAAEREFERALELDPNSMIAHWWYAFYLCAMARYDEGIAMALRAQELDPLSPIVAASVAWAHFRAGQLQESFRKSKKVTEEFGNLALGHTVLGWNHWVRGECEQAIRENEKELELNPGNSMALGYGAQIRAACGRRDEALGLFEQARELARRQYFNPYYLATASLALGDEDQAIEYLEKAHAERSPTMVLLKIDRFLDPLRDDPRFQDLLRRMDFPQN